MEEHNLYSKLEELINQKGIYQKNVLTLQEAAIYCGRSTSNLYKLTSAGIIPHSKPEGKIIYIAREKLEEWMLKNPIKTVGEIEQEAATLVTLNNTGRGGAKRC
ncbi:helix-turn-helix domain-containing protein [Pontibacter populi]|uniref:Helix-turn-helix domain-containing protein n=1 Tax=Pontibacter populi TaxID=890055 RepID=A0ABV1RY31_9BACT